ncbi:MAG: endonuclease/exonuclease/phosphatase family protein [Acidimicrobiales bacterium]
MRIVTLNLRNTADRWVARRQLLVRQLVDLAPDVAGFQEARVVPDQAAWIVREVERRSAGVVRYRSFRRSKAGLLGLWEGLAVLSRLPVVATASIALGADARVAQRVTVRLRGGGHFDVYNTHFGGDRGALLAEAARIDEWMARRPPLPAVLLGDFNARPGSPPIELLSSRLRSAHAAVHGHEPPRTVPTPLRAGVSGAGSVLDFVFVNDLVEVLDAGLAFDEVDPDDPTLATSDHYGLAVTVDVRRTRLPGPGS